MQVQLTDIVSEFQDMATKMVMNLDSPGLHKLADELDKINSAAQGLTALKTELDALAPVPVPAEVPATV